MRFPLKKVLSMFNFKKDENRIVLCGAYYELGNFGDVLLKELLEEKIYEVMPEAKVHVIDKNYSFKQYMADIIRGAAFIYVPGGYMGYIEKWYSGNKKKSRQRMHYYLSGILFGLHKRPMALLGGDRSI